MPFLWRWEVFEIFNYYLFGRCLEKPSCHSQELLCVGLSVPAVTVVTLEGPPTEQCLSAIFCYTLRTALDLPKLRACVTERLG